MAVDLVTFSPVPGGGWRAWHGLARREQSATLSHRRPVSRWPWRGSRKRLPLARHSRRESTKDTALSALAAVMGSVVGGSATITTAWITQRTQSWRDVPKAELGNGRASRIRLTSSAPVVEAAEQTVRTILAQYFAPNLTTDQLKEAALSRTADPVKPFSEACRQELADLRRRTG